MVLTVSQRTLIVNYEIVKGICDFQSRQRCRETRLTSSHNLIKITTKLENNHFPEPSEIELNGSLTTTELKKPHLSTRSISVEMQKHGESEQAGPTTTCRG